MADAPVIETARLRLRAHRIDDIPARIAMTADLETMRFIGGAAQSEEENWTRLCRYAGQWTLLGRGLFAIEERASGRFVGEAGLADFHRGLGADFDGAPEAAWVLARGAAGQGYAREAMTAAIAWHERAFGPERIVCIVAPENTASLRLAAKLGFTDVREAPYHGHAVRLMQRPPVAIGS